MRDDEDAISSVDEDGRIGARATWARKANGADSMLRRFMAAWNRYVFWVNGLDVNALSDKEATRRELDRLIHKSLLWIVVGVPLGIAMIALIAWVVWLIG
jgi:hypothetical protein